MWADISVHRSQSFFKRSRHPEQLSASSESVDEDVNLLTRFLETETNSQASSVTASFAACDRIKTSY